MRDGTEGLRLIDSCITQLKAQGPSRTCDESKEGRKDRGVSVHGERCVDGKLITFQEVGG